MSRVYFTDRNLGKRFPAILTAAGLEVERHHDLFPPNGSDEQWLEYCGTNNRIAITHDQRIRHKINEREAVMRYTFLNNATYLPAFVMTEGAMQL